MATSCATNGVAGTLLLVPISTNTRLGVLYLKLRKMVQYACNSSW
jgi:hypothetical protein